MELPKWNDLKRNYPAAGVSDVCSLIGGKIKYNCDQNYFENVCAIRVSRLLNKSGSKHLIPYMKNLTSSGVDRNWYIFKVKTLTEYLKDKYKKPEILIPTNHEIELKGRKGIIIYQVIGWGNATGHAD